MHFSTCTFAQIGGKGTAFFSFVQETWKLFLCRKFPIRHLSAMSPLSLRYVSTISPLCLRCLSAMPPLSITAKGRQKDGKKTAKGRQKDGIKSREKRERTPILPLFPPVSCSQQPYPRHGSAFTIPPPHNTNHFCCLTPQKQHLRAIFEEKDNKICIYEKNRLSLRAFCENISKKTED
ncbi:MAG: hypothetical protein II970_01420 [Paludibacteraceae bacterium]|nr:hypothetical protein [Paludibacteraceae bacterium]